MNEQEIASEVVEENKFGLEDQIYSFGSRDLSWLSFNYRVLLEAEDASLPLYERIKFLAIFSSNLDEFYRVRVAHWQNLAQIEKEKLKSTIPDNPVIVLRRIHRTVNTQLQKYGRLFRKIIFDQLRTEGIIIYQNENILKSHRDVVRHYFRSKVLTYLHPVILNAKKSRLLFLNNKCLYLALSIRRKRDESKRYCAILNIPSEELPRFVNLPDIRGKKYYIFLDDVIRANLEFLFPGYFIEECVSIKLNRDADLQIDDEFSGNLAEKIRTHLSRRNIGNPSRFLFDKTASPELINYLCERYGISQHELVPGGRYHNLNDFMSLPNPKFPRLSYPTVLPLRISSLDDAHSIFGALKKRDIMLHFPYQSYDYVLRFFNEAAIDPKVREIKITLYRIASNSFIANSLINAAQNGKKVTVFVELKARFDEENNLRWAEKMKNAGIKIIYSLPGLKVHAKVALITRKAGGEKIRYGYLGTGNFNEKTADLYADHALLTSNEDMLKELNLVFNYLTGHPEPPVFNHLLVAQFNMTTRFLEMIEREVQYALQGKKGHIIIKVNNLEEPGMVWALCRAADLGVKIDLIARSICCLTPENSNIRIIRLVDRYLEHTRSFWFNNDGNDELYLASADWMTRNLYHRIEVGFPVYDPKLKKEIEQELLFQLADNTKAFLIKDTQDQEKIKPGNQPKVRAQVDYHKWLKERCV